MIIRLSRGLPLEGMERDVAARTVYSEGVCIWIPLYRSRERTALPHAHFRIANITHKSDIHFAGL